MSDLTKLGLIEEYASPNQVKAWLKEEELTGVVDWFVARFEYNYGLRTMRMSSHGLIQDVFLTFSIKPHLVVNKAEVEQVIIDSLRNSSSDNLDINFSLLPSHLLVWICIW